MTKMKKIFYLLLFWICVLSETATERTKDVVDKEDSFCKSIQPMINCGNTLIASICRKRCSYYMPANQAPDDVCNISDICKHEGGRLRCMKTCNAYDEFAVLRHDDGLLRDKVEGSFCNEIKSKGYCRRYIMKSICQKTCVYTEPINIAGDTYCNIKGICSHEAGRLKCMKTCRSFNEFSAPKLYNKEGGSTTTTLPPTTLPPTTLPPTTLPPTTLPPTTLPPTTLPRTTLSRTTLPPTSAFDLLPIMDEVPDDAFPNNDGKSGEQTKRICTVTKEQCLNAHIAKRTMHKVPYLFWSEHLAIIVRDQLTKKKNWNWSSYTVKGKPDNLCKAAVEEWYDNGRSFEYDNPTKHFEKLQPFMRLIWKSSRNFGCAAICKDDLTLVGCKYYRPKGFEWTAKNIKENVLPLTTV